MNSRLPTNFVGRLLLHQPTTRFFSSSPGLPQLARDQCAGRPRVGHGEWGGPSHPDVAHPHGDTGGTGPGPWRIWLPEVLSFVGEKL